MATPRSSKCSLCARATAVVRLHLQTIYGWCWRFRIRILLRQRNEEVSTHASLAQLANSPFGNRQRPLTQSVCSFSTLTHFVPFHSLMVLSAPPVMNSVSETAITAHTAPSWPSRTNCVSQFFQTRAVLQSFYQPGSFHRQRRPPQLPIPRTGNYNIAERVERANVVRMAEQCVARIRILCSGFSDFDYGILTAADDKALW